MLVHLLTYTPDPLRVMFAAARTCYAPDPAYLIWQDHDSEAHRERMLRTVRGCIVRNHNSVMRHASFTFAIDRISRACANQLTRHGPGWAFDQQSLRYVKLDTEPDWVIPDHLDDTDRQQMVDAANAAWDKYCLLIANGVKPEDARGVLPHCTPTNLVATVNLAALLHFWNVRFKGTTGRPQDEIRDLAGRMVALVVAAEPWLAEFFPEATGT